MRCSRGRCIRIHARCCRRCRCRIPTCHGIGMLRGDVPSATAVPKGCRFAPRCPLAEPRCLETDPPLTVVEDGRSVACLLAS